MAAGGKRDGAGRPKNNEAVCSLQIRVPVKYRALIKRLVALKLNELSNQDNTLTK